MVNQTERFNKIVDTVLSVNGTEEQRPLLPKTRVAEGVGELVVADMGMVVFSRDFVVSDNQEFLRRTVEVPEECTMVFTREDEGDQATRILEHSYGRDARVSSIIQLATHRTLESPEIGRLNRWLEHPFITAFPGKLVKRLNLDEEDELARFKSQVDSFERRLVEIDIAYRQTGFIQDRDWGVPYLVDIPR